MIDGTLRWLSYGTIPAQVGAIIFFGVCLAGTVFHRSSGPATPEIAELNPRRLVRIVLLWIAGNGIIGLVFGFWAGFRGVPPDVPTLVVKTALFIAWGIFVGCVAARRSAWPFETLLFLVVLTAPLSVLESLMMPRTIQPSIQTWDLAKFVTGEVLWATAIAMLAWGVHQTLSRYWTPKVWARSPAGETRRRPQTCGVRHEGDTTQGCRLPHEAQP